MTRAMRAALPLEIVAAWLLLICAATAIFVTYTRIPQSELYHYSDSGLAGAGAHSYTA